MNNKIRGISGLLKSSWESFVNNWSKIILFQVLGFLLVLIPISIFASSFITTGMRNQELLKTLSAVNWYNPTTVEINQLQHLMVLLLTNPLFWLGVIAIVGVSLVYNLAFTKYVYGLAENESTNFKESYLYSFKNLLPYFVVSLLFALAILLGFVLLIIPGIIFLVWFSLFLPVFVKEEKRGASALKRSKELVSGYFWPVFGRLLFFTIAVSIFNRILGSNYQNESVNTFVSLISVIFSLIVAPVGLLYSYNIYKDLFAIKGNK
jgi:hypothetical protein